MYAFAKPYTYAHLNTRTHWHTNAYTHKNNSDSSSDPSTFAVIHCRHQGEELVGEIVVTAHTWIYCNKISPFDTNIGAFMLLCCLGEDVNFSILYIWWIMSIQSSFEEDLGLQPPSSYDFFYSCKVIKRVLSLVLSPAGYSSDIKHQI